MSESMFPVTDCLVLEKSKRVCVLLYRSDGGGHREWRQLRRPATPAAGVLWDVCQPYHNTGTL